MLWLSEDVESNYVTDKVYSLLGIMKRYSTVRDIGGSGIFFDTKLTTAVFIIMMNLSIIPLSSYT